MPNPGSEEPLTKVTLNLFTADVEELRRRYPSGWTGWIRDLVNAELNQPRRMFFNERD